MERHEVAFAMEPTLSGAINQILVEKLSKHPGQPALFRALKRAKAAP